MHLSAAQRERLVPPGSAEPEHCSSAAPASRHQDGRQPWAAASPLQWVSAGRWAGHRGPHFLFTAFNLVNNGVSLLVTHSAKYLRHLKGETVRIGKKPVFKYCKRRSE